MSKNEIKATEKEFKEANEAFGKVTVTLKIPEPVFHFYRAYAETYDKKIEQVLVEEIVNNVKLIVDSNEASEILVGAFGLREYIES